MKIKPKNIESFDDYAYSHGFNPEELINFKPQRLLPSDYKTLVKYTWFYYNYDSWFNDLYDPYFED